MNTSAVGAASPRDRIAQIVSDVQQIEDPLLRARAAGELAQAVHDIQHDVRAIRGEAVARLREQGMTYQQIGDAIGVHFSVVPRLLAGAGRGVSAQRYQQTCRQAKTWLTDPARPLTARQVRQRLRDKYSSI